MRPKLSEQSVNRRKSTSARAIDTQYIPALLSYPTVVPVTTLQYNASTNRSFCPYIMTRMPSIPIRTGGKNWSAKNLIVAQQLFDPADFDLLVECD